MNLAKNGFDSVSMISQSESQFQLVFMPYVSLECSTFTKSAKFNPAHTRRGDLCFCRFTDLPTASVPAFQPAEIFMTSCPTQSGPFFRVLKGQMKATPKLRLPHPRADWPLRRMLGRFLRDNADMPPAYWVKVHNCASFFDVSTSV